ncbi:hypothetical protein Tco_0663300 [Tanacetum coccineum]
MESQSETTQTVSTLKLLILKTGDYDLWSMRMVQYLTHTDYALWEVIVNRFQNLFSNLKFHVKFYLSGRMQIEACLRSLPSAGQYVNKEQSSSSTYADDVIDGSQMAGGHAYHEGEEILKEERKESEFQWQRNSTTNALVVQEGIGCYDWSFRAEEGITNFALNGLSYPQGSSKFIKSSDSEDYQNGLESQKARIVPPPYTRNYMPSRPDLSFAGLDDSVYKTKVSETETSISKTSKDIIEKPKTVRPSAPIIEDWDTDSDNDSVFRPKSDQTKPKFTKINFVKSDENVKSVNKENTHRQVEYPRKSQSPRDNRRN